jgi:serine/threonine protein kinase
LKKLGSGSFAVTHLCKHKKTGDDRVVKAVEKSKMRCPIEDIEKEIQIMRQIDHPHIVRLYEWYEGTSTVYLIIDALKGGTLREVVMTNYYKQGTPLKEDWIQKVIHQVTEAMVYIHSLRLIHKDLKDENIMLLKKDRNYDKPFAVIIDLGIAEMFPLSDPRGNIVGGTPATMAPEVWMGNFGPKCDVWSVGCVLFELLAGAMPFMAMTLDPKEWLRKMQKGPDWNLVKTSAEGRNLCERMLIFDDKQRPTMKECLEHKWFECHSRTLQNTVHPQQFAELKRFTEMTALARSMLLEIAGRLPMERAEKIVQIFKAFDKNSDGSISKDELQQGFSRLGMKDQGLLDNTFKALDVDENGTLSFSEFAAGVLLVFKDLLESRFRALFRRYDKDCDGMMTQEDVEGFLSIARKLTKKEAVAHHKELISQLFPGNTAKVSYEQLRRTILPGYS